MQFNKKFLFALIPLALIIALVYYFLDIVTYILLAWVVAMIGAPLMKMFRKIFSRTLSALLTLLSFTLLLSLLIWLFIPPLFEQARNLSGIDYEKVVKTLEEPIASWTGMDQYAMDEIEITEDPKVVDRVRIDTIIQMNDELQTQIIINLDLPNEQQNEITNDTVEENLFSSFRKSIYKVLDPAKIPAIFSSIVGFLGNFVVTIMSIFFISFFFLKEQGLFGSMISSIVPNKYEDRVNKMLDKSSVLLIRYFVGMATQVCVITFFVSLILGLFGVKNALLIGFFAALMNIIPYLGPLIGATFGALITISSNLDQSFNDVVLPQLLIIAGVFMIIQLMDNFILQPTIFSKSVKAHPLEIFIIVLVGAKVGGIIGMVIAIPSYTVFRVMAQLFLGEFKIVRKITSGI